LEKTNTSWEILHEGAFVEILARLAMLELEGNNRNSIYDEKQ
jgi:hypothetical protein